MTELTAPKGWLKRQLVDMVAILDSQRIPINNKERQERLAATEKRFPYYGATGQVGDIDDFIFDGQAVLLGEDAAPFLEPYKAKAYLVNGKFWVNNHAHILRGTGAMDNAFLCHQLNVLNYQGFVSGTTRLKLTQASMKELPLWVPPFNEQQRIVEKIETLFAQLDKGEEAVREVQKLLTRYRQSVLKAAVTGQLTKSDRSGWEAVELGSLLDDLRYGTAQKCGYEVASTAVLRIPNVAGGEISIEDLKYTDLPERDAAKLALELGDILVVRSNGSANLVGRGAVVSEAAVGMAFAGYLIRMRVNRDRVLPEYVHLSMSAPQTRSLIERQARSTSGVHNINSGEINAIAMELPSIPEQVEIIAAVEDALSKIAVLDVWCATELKRSASLRQSILKEAFAGRLVPQDPTDEPASALLARIAAEKTTAKKPRRKSVS